MQDTRSDLGGASENPEEYISDFDSFERSLESKLDGPRSDHSFGDQQTHIGGLLSQLDDEPALAADQSQASKPEPVTSPTEPRPPKKHSAAALIAANKLKRKRRKGAIRAKKYRERKRTIDVEKALEQLDAIPRPLIGRAARENYDKRLAALLGATSAPNARQSLVQIREREEEITTAWQAKAAYGETKVSVAKIAKSYPGKTEWQMRNLLKIIRRLEQPGGPWHGLG